MTTASLPTAVTGWMHPNNSPLAHWGDGTRVLCGRTVPTGTQVVNTDPHADVKRCLKCDRALTRERPASATSSAPATDSATPAAPEVTWAVGMPVEFTYGFPNPDTRATGVIKKIFESGHRLYNKDCQIRYGQAFYYRDFSDLTPTDAQAEAAPEQPEAPLPTEAQPGDAIRFQVPAFEPTPLGLQQVPWNRVLPSPLNPRKAFDAAALKELAISIHGEGLQQNLVVRPYPDRHGFYEVAAGERRYRAIGLLVTGFEREGHQWVEVPDTYPVNVLVQRLTDLELLQIATAENVQRRRMTPLEEADAFAAMIDRGATVPELHARFGLGQRTIARRVEISRHLIPDLRALYDAGKLTLGQVEILAQATPGLQEDLLRRQLKYTQATTPEQLKLLIHDAVFPTSRAQFPRTWYAGTVTAADLFGDMPERFDDFDLAMSLQVKHAVAQAQEDVKNGAVFADVTEGPETQLWRYVKAGQGDSGVVYTVNTRTGELARHTGYLINPSYPAPQYRFEAPRRASPHETPDQLAGPASERPAAAQTPAASQPTPAVSGTPRYTPYGLTSHVATQLSAVPTAGLAALIYACTYDGQGYLETEASRTAAQELVRLTGGLMEIERGHHLKVGVQYGLHHVLPALLAAPEQVLLDVWQGLAASMIEIALDADSAGHLIQSGQAGWTLTETYLAGCNTFALHEIWDDAGLGDRANTTDESLRAMLLDEAPKLAERHFLPRPLRPEDAEGAAHA
ncbi:ParB/RepB/Spo0J family partition protein [Deinococcus sp.]|uniref:ParB/RepB/Spo0J family partition protein n=1 Tax=Deinococcus sp. TaxID=47478 RepID=UPI00391CEA17